MGRPSLSSYTEKPSAKTGPQRLPAIGARSSKIASATTVGFGNSSQNPCLRRTSSQTLRGGLLSGHTGSGCAKAEGLVAQPIDINAVVHGSQACSVYALWAIALLREFFTLQ